MEIGTYYIKIYDQWEDDPCLCLSFSAKVSNNMEFEIGFTSFSIICPMADIKKPGNCGIYSGASCKQYIRFVDDNNKVIEEFIIPKDCESDFLLNNILPKIEIVAEKLKTAFLLNKME